MAGIRLANGGRRGRRETTGGVTTPSAALIVSTPQKELDTF
jgi:hypothetical protein